VKVLVTGAAGQLGRALLATAPTGPDVLGLTRAELDLSDTAAIAALVAREKPGLIINAAAYTAVDRAESDADAAYAVNRDAAGALASAAASAGARLVHVSTDFVFDGQASTPYAPDAPTAPLGVYGASKLAGEKAVRAALTGALIVRTAWVYAADGQNFVRTMLRLMGERDEVRVVADQIGTPTHARSLARAIWTLSAVSAAGTGVLGTYHWTDAGVASWYDLAVAIQEEALGLGLLTRAVPVRPIATSDYPTPAQRPAYSVLDKRSTWALAGEARHWRAELRDCLSEMKALSS
jgi:dTDP-4-dehydrorhamnose reductase